MKPQTYFIETWGCQMNVLDSQRLAGLLDALGLSQADRVGGADVALLNTCSVREKAMQKVLSRLGELRDLQGKTGRPRIVGLCGCVGEQEGATLLGRSPVLSFVLGPGKMDQLGSALNAVVAGKRLAVTGFTDDRAYDPRLIKRHSTARQYVTAIHGCNQHCTFCIVPTTRGREVSRPLEEITAEVEELVARGTLEVTLLGQTINAYCCPASQADLADLLEAVSRIEGLWRVQFLTSHPAFFSERIIDVMVRQPRIGGYLHLPVQAGSNSVLRRMARRYTREEYVDLVARIRRALPRITLSSDVIVGFPGESDADFQETLALVDELQFGQLFGFVFSPRPGTPAARIPVGVPSQRAKERLERLFALQGSIQLDLNSRLIGSRAEVLVDGPTRRGSHQWHGRAEDNRVVNFPAWENICAGELVVIEITGATPHALVGERREDPTPPPGLTGGSGGLRLLA